jgi:hypothetical protein
MMGSFSPGARAALLTAVLLAAAPLGGCDFFERAREEVEEATELPPPPVPFSTLILSATPLPPDKDGSGPDLYVEIQAANGRAAYSAPSVLEDATEAALPYVLSDGGELTGTTRAYAVVVLDRDTDGYDAVASSETFTADGLRASASDTFAVANLAGTLRAELVLTR